MSKIIIYVEGKEDARILKEWFSEDSLIFRQVGGKSAVINNVKANKRAWGILDRDFAPSPQVKNSKGKDIVILDYYCIENYLIVPEAINILYPDAFRSVNELENWVIEKAKELVYYIAINKEYNRLWNKIEEKDCRLKYFENIPPIDRKEILSKVQECMSIFPQTDSVNWERFVNKLDRRANKLKSILTNLEIVNKYVNGKILLEKVIYEKFKEDGYKGKYKDFLDILILETEDYAKPKIEQLIKHFR